MKCPKHEAALVLTKAAATASDECPRAVLQEHYEKLKAARDSAEHLCDETARQLARTEKQLGEAQHALDSSNHEVTCFVHCRVCRNT